MSTQQNTGFSRRARTITGLVTGLAIAVLLAMMWQQMPRPYATDLDRIGSGKPALVLAHDDHRIASGEQMAALTTVREGLERHLVLLVANLREDKGARFARRHNAEPAMVLIFDADGRLLARIRGPVDGPALRQHVAAVLDTGSTDNRE